MYRLIFLNGSMKGRRVAVQQGSVLIGRGPECHIDLSDDDEVSRRHASIMERDGQYYLADMGAMNQVLVNGVPAQSEVALKQGDRLEVGRTQLEFQIIQEHAPLGAARRISTLQWITFAVVGAVLLGELFFVFVMPLWQGQAPLDAASIAAARAAMRPAAAVTNAPVAPPPSKDPEMARARSMIDAMAAESNSRPEIAFTPPVSPNALAPLPPPPIAPAPLPQVVVPVPSNDVPVLAAVLVTAQPPVRVVAPAPLEEDPLLLEVKAMLKTARARAAAGDLAQADQTLDRIQIMLPDYLPAYQERARLLEKRGMLRAASDQWGQVMNRSSGTPAYTEAVAERQRLARLEQAAKTAPRPVPPPPQGAENKGIRIVSVDREKFQSTREYDEMRVVRVNLRPPAGRPVDTAEVQVLVTFYDRNTDTGKAAPTRAVTPDDTLRLEGSWAEGETRTVTATYTVPRDFRAAELSRRGERCVYHGYRVQVFYKGQLQDEEAMPRDVLDLPAPKLPARNIGDMPVGR